MVKRKVTYDKKCIVCGNIFNTARQSRVTCSSKCAKIHHGAWCKNNPEKALVNSNRCKIKNRDNINKNRRDKRASEAWESKNFKYRKEYAGNKENRAKSYSDWYKRNKDAKYVLTRKYQLQKPVKLKVKDTECCYCGGSQNLTTDHLVPLSEGGTNLPQNLVTACSSCNISKRNTDFMKWYRNQTFYSPLKEFNILQGFLAG